MLVHRLPLPPRLAGWRTTIARVRADYRAIHGHNPALFWPRRFTEKMQWRKLFEPDPRFAIFCDKLATHHYVAERLGAEAPVPLLWSGATPEEIPFDWLVPPYVLKPSHASGRVAVVQAAPDEAALRAAAAEWLGYCHGTQMTEPGYLAVPRRLMAERFMAAADGGPAPEYRLFGFDGRVQLIQATVPVGPQRRWAVAYYDRDWRPVPMKLRRTPEPLPMPPADRQARMLEIAECLAAGQGHLRVDLYNAAEAVRVGELTAYCWSGLTPFSREADDLRLGAHWRLPAPGWRALAAVLWGSWGPPVPRPDMR
jgi:hypothetical protein